MPNRNINEEQTINYGLYQLDNEYKVRTNFIKYIEECQNFYNGIQYPNDNYKNMIRVTMNFCSFSSNLKAAKIVGTQRYITFTAENTDYDCSALRRFDEYNCGKLDEKTEDFQAALDGFNNGTAISYYRWDKDDTTYKGIYKGGLCLEQIDILRFAVANPYVKGIQNQKWVMYWNNEDVYAVRDMLERKDKEERERVLKHIVPENFLNNPYDNYDDSSINHGLTTVFTRFFRIKGEVFFMCSTRNVDLFEYPHALSPRAEKSMKNYVKKIVEEYKERTKKEDNENFDRVCDYRIDVQDMISQITDTEMLFDDEEYRKVKEKFCLYPFAEYAPFAINNSFYGRPDIKEMIPIQKGINFALSMMLKCIENNAYNKIIEKEGALQGQIITNEPSQVLTDHSRMTNGFGIKFAESQPLPNGVADFTDRLFAMTRVVYGFNDVMDGSVSNQDISGYAVQLMVKQANSSIEQQQQKFWKYCKDKAAIRLMFYKHYVDKAKYTYELEDYEVEKRENSRNKLLRRQQQLQAQGQQLEIGDIDLTQPTRKVQIRDFKGDDIYGINFDIGIDVMQGLADSKLAESQMWDTLIMNGNIQNMEPEMLELYLDANPTVSERTKAKLKAVVEKQKQSENVQLKQKLQEAVQYLQKLLQYSKELEAQNGYKTNYIDNLTKEFTQKIGVANKVITSQNKALSAKNGVGEGEAKSNNARGVGGTSIAPEQGQ